MILSFDIGIKNLSYTIFDYIEKKIVDWQVICLSEKKKITLDEITPILLLKLIELDIEQITYILIENQPVMKNPVMKSIQMVIYTYFHHFNILNEKQINIKFISAMNKLKCGIDIEYPDKIKEQKNKYMQKKKKAIYLCEYILKNEIINNSSEYLNLFELSKKKDDLADSFLYCIYFMNKNNLNINI